MKPATVINPCAIYSLHGVHAMDCTFQRCYTYIALLHV
jgi:hypothetical protein